MIEVTEEMLDAFFDTAKPNFTIGDLRKGLGAVMAIVERDYEPRCCNAMSWVGHRCTKPDGHEGGHQHKWSGVVWP